MILKIYGSNQTRIVKLNAAFFTTQKIKRKGIIENITPSRKAQDLASDLLGHTCKGYILEENGKILENTLPEPPKEFKF